MRMVGHWRRVGQGLWVVRLVVLIWKVVQDIARVMRGWQALGMRMLVEVVWHLRLVCSWCIIVGNWGHIGRWSQPKHSLQTSMTIFGLMFMVHRSRCMIICLWLMVCRSMKSWLWLMIHWSRSMVVWLWMRSWMICSVNSKDFF